MQNRLKRISLAIALAAYGMVVVTDAVAQSRMIFVNGARMNAQEVAFLDLLNCGNPVPNGRYWLDLQTGAWGYENGPLQGYLQPCDQQQPQQAQPPASSGGFWEDRMCEQYGVCDLGR